MSSKEKWNKGREFFSITSRSSFLRAKLRRVGGFFFRGGGNPTDWNVLGGGKIVLHRTRYSNLVGWFSRRGGIIEARGGAARIKASCGIKNLCNQLSNLLPHISRPMSRPPLSLPLPLSPRRSPRGWFHETLDPPSTLFSRGGGCSSSPFPLFHPPPRSNLYPLPAQPRGERRRSRRAFVWDIKYLFS